VPHHRGRVAHRLPALPEGALVEDPPLQLHIERTFGETRRRVKVIGRLPGERSCLSLVWAVLDRATRGWRGVKHTPATTRLLADLRRQLLEPPVSIAPKPSEEVATETVTAVA